MRYRGLCWRRWVLLTLTTVKICQGSAGGLHPPLHPQTIVITYHEKVYSLSVHLHIPILSFVYKNILCYNTNILLTKLVIDNVDISIFYPWIMFISVYTIWSFVGIIEGVVKQMVICEVSIYYNKFYFSQI